MSVTSVDTQNNVEQNSSHFLSMLMLDFERIS